MKKTYITKMPDKAGAFLKASRIIASNNGNIVRVSYNKAIDMYTLFIEVSAEKLQLERISTELKALGYLSEKAEENQVILIVLTLADIPGSVTPILEVLNNYDISISYMSSQENGTALQHFKMGLLIENVQVIKDLLDEISKLCEVEILEYDVTETALDNTVFYLRFANEMRRMLSLSQKQTNSIIINSNRIMQFLDERNESPHKTFDYIKRFAKFIVDYKGRNFNAFVSQRKITDDVTMYIIEPPCGSNTYILEHNDELLFFDCGFACFKDEMSEIFNKLFSNFSTRKKSIAITHADIDHTGLLSIFDTVYVNKSCYENFVFEQNGEPNFREQNLLHAPYSKLSKIISGYVPPSLANLKIIGQKKDDEILSRIGTLNFADMYFDVYEGNGGHVKGESIFVCTDKKIIFTGDIIVNIKGFSEPQKQFNRLAPYLMTSVNADSEKATLCRNEVLKKFPGFTFCPGHGHLMEKY